MGLQERLAFRKVGSLEASASHHTCALPPLLVGDAMVPVHCVVQFINLCVKSDLRSTLHIDALVDLRTCAPPWLQECLAFCTLAALSSP